jgi:hypothetical protein
VPCCGDLVCDESNQRCGIRSGGQCSSVDDYCWGGVPCNTDYGRCCVGLGGSCAMVDCCSEVAQCSGENPPVETCIPNPN